jgi:hypothetical protein
MGHVTTLIPYRLTAIPWATKISLVDSRSFVAQQNWQLNRLLSAKRKDWFGETMFTW